MMKQASGVLAAVTAGLAHGKAMVGTNIGGWMVLEPWITPSLFYRFLGKTHSEGVGMDCWTFCEALGPEKANEVMRAHWDEWLKEEHFSQLAERGVELVRIPIGDWTLNVPHLKPPPGPPAVVPSEEGAVAEAGDPPHARNLFSFLALLLQTAQRIAVSMLVQSVAATAVANQNLRSDRLLTLLAVAVFFIFLQSGASAVNNPR